MGTRLARLVGLRPGETAPVLLTLVYLAIVVAAFLLAKPVRNGLFLEAHRAEDLWIVYVLVPLALSLVVPLYSRVVARRGHRQAIIGTLVFFGLNALVFWYLFTFHSRPGLAVALYVWVNCVGAIAPAQAWAFAASLFDARQAKRVLGIVGAGASLGAIAGGLLARSLVEPVGGAVNLLLVMAGLLGLAAAAVAVTWHWVPRRRPHATEFAERVPIRGAVRLVVRTPYLAQLAALVTLSTITTQWVGYQFSVAARARFGADADRLTSWFGEFNVVAGVAALLLQAGTGPLLGRIGIGPVLLCLPLVLGGGTLLVLVTGAFWTVVLTAAGDQVVRFSLDKAAYELLYAPVARGVRGPVKALLDIVGVRSAEAVGGLLLGVATGALPLVTHAPIGIRGTAALVLLLVVPWVVAAVILARGYVEAIRDSVRAHRLDVEAGPAAVLERSAAALIAAKLRGEDAGEVRYALSMLERDRPKRHPAVRLLLDHPAADIRQRAVALLRASGDRAALPEVARLVRDADLATRTEALLYLTQFARIDPVRQIEQLGTFPDFSIRAGIAAFLAHPGPQQNLDAARVLIAGVVGERGAEGRSARLEAARLLRVVPPELGDLIDPLLDDEDTEVAREAIRTAGQLKRCEAAERLIPRLADPDLAAEASEAIVALGAGVLEPLGRALRDEATPIPVRRAIPPTLGRVAAPEAAETLLEAVSQRDPVVRFRAVRALNKLRRATPVRPDETEREALETVLAAEIVGHYRSYQVLGRLLAPGDGGDAAVLAELRRAMDRELERIFRLLALLFPGEDLRAAYEGLRAEDPALRANAVEWLDHVLRPPSLRTLLVPLIDPHVSVDARVEQANRLLGARIDSRTDALAMLLASDDPWLKAAALTAIGAFGAGALEAEVARALDSPDELVRRAARAAKAQLEAAAGTAALEPAGRELVPGESVGAAPAAVGIG